MLVWYVDVICPVYSEGNKDVFWPKHRDLPASWPHIFITLWKNRSDHILLFWGDVREYGWNPFPPSLLKNTTPRHLKGHGLVCPSSVQQCSDGVILSQVKIGNTIRSKSHFHQGITGSPWQLPLNVQSQLHSVSSLGSKCKWRSSPQLILRYGL